MLDRPLSLRCGLVLPNRTALAAMTNGQSHDDGTLGDDELAWLARRADGGFGMVHTCAAHVAQDGKAWRGQLGIDRDDDLPGLTRLAARLRAAGTQPMVQLFHGGVRADPALTGERVWSASEVATGNVTPRAATADDLARVIDQFAAAAARAEAAGFAGVELHGAHGYLLSQFLSRTQNVRDDGWGGDLAGRARLVREATRAVRARVGAGFAVGVRLSLEDGGQAVGLDLDEGLEVARGLAADGADFIHASLWDVRRMTRKRPAEHALPLLRAALPREVAIVACGAMWTAEDAAFAIERGADVVAVARAGIVNPDWGRQVQVPGWQPRRPPLTRAELAAVAVSPRFAQYLTIWKNFVAD